MRSKDNPPPPSTIEWGRRKHASSSNGLKAITLMLFTPVLTLLLTVNMEHHHGSLWQILDMNTPCELWQDLSLEKSLLMHQVVAGYLVFQALLYKVLPGAYHSGQHTPGGRLLWYKTNGLSAFVATYACFWLGHTAGLYKASFIATNFTTLIAVLNVWGLTLTLGAYVKARVSPTSMQDRVFTGNLFYDICMGVELNPRLPIIDDVKLFVVGRVGMMGWPLVLTSFAALQYENTDHLSTAMVVGVALQFEYVIDFFAYEHWYLRTIDVAHDHVGFYIMWACFAWLPATYTLHAQFMAHSGSGIRNDIAVLCFIIGTLGYTLFRLANNQKYRVRETKGMCNVWGKPATFITARYSTADGARRESILLTCGTYDMRVEGPTFRVELER